jgi:formate dehydrogenase major subunit
MQPQVFVELSEELAELKGIKNGERVLATSARGQLECTAIVTKRLKPLDVSGQLGSKVHQVGFPWCFGWQKPNSGKEESANLLTPSTGDPNTRIPETKAFMVNIQKI